MTQQNFFTHGQRGQDKEGQVFGQQTVRALPAPTQPTSDYGVPPTDRTTYAASAYPSGQPSAPADGIPVYPPGYIPRKFFFKGQEYADPGPNYSIQQVLDAMADHFPELKGGTWSVQKRPEDGGEDITFQKVAGEKGVSFAAVGAKDLKKHPPQSSD
jgi:PRTRC genetic system protein C